MNHYNKWYIITGWWFGTMEFYDFPIILGMSSSHLTNSHGFLYRFFREVGQPRASDFWDQGFIWKKRKGWDHFGSFQPNN